MQTPSDMWLIRLPDGRVIRAKSTESVRHNVERGRIPLDCRVRRTAEEEWQALEWTSEFADLARQRLDHAAAAAGASVSRAARDDGSASRSSHELRTFGVPGLIEELFHALDGTLSRPKLMIAAALGLLTGVVLLLIPLLPSGNEFPWTMAPWVLAGLTIVLLVALASVVVTQMTFVELSRLRPARRGEATERLFGKAGRITAAYVLLGGGLLAALAGLHEWSAGLSDPGAEATEWPSQLGVALALVLEVMLWSILGVALLLVPIVVIEECRLARAFRLWGALLRQHLGRVLLYEGLALGLGVLAVLPLLFPVAVAGTFALAEGALLAAKSATLTILAGLALSPLFVYLVVANVSIYLHLRYEFAAPSK